MKVLVTGAAGFIGRALAEALANDPAVQHIVLTDAIMPKELPPQAATATVAAAAKAVPPDSFGSTEKQSQQQQQQQQHRAKITYDQTDLTDPAAVARLATPDTDVAYLLHGIMSGATEADLELGLRVNVDATQLLLDALRRARPKPAAANASANANANDEPGFRPIKVVYTSTCAVYASTAACRGGAADPVSDARTVPRPAGSYGAQKLACEALLHDLGRRGLLDARVVRLPTVIVRPGRPSGAASSFCSGIFREPLARLPARLPVGRRDLRVWVCSARTVVRNLLWARDVAADALGSEDDYSCAVNLPGVTVTVQDMLAALEAVGGKEALDLVDSRPDPDVEKIVYRWATDFDTSRANALGFMEDGPLERTVREYIEDYGSRQ